MKRSLSMKASDLRVQRTRKAIDDAFWELMKKKDFEEITINDISELACINRVTFYHHYVDKYQWLETMIEKFFSGFDSMILKIVNFEDDESVKEGFWQSVLFLNEHYTLLSILLHNRGTNFFQQRYKAILVELMKKDPHYHFSDPATADFWMNYMASAYVGAYEWWIKNDRPIPVDKLAENLYHAFERIIIK